MIEVPEKIKEFNFVLIGEDGKKPFEKGWQKKIHRFNDPIFQKHISEGKNYGVQSNNSSIVIEGKPYFLIIIDFDKKEFQDKIIDKFPKTFTTTSGSQKKCVHLWFACDNNKAFKIKDEKLNTLADIIGSGNQVIAPWSKHISGSTYSIIEDIPIVFISYAEIEAILKPYDLSPKKIEKPKKEYQPKDMKKDMVSKIYNYTSMKEILEEFGVDTSKNPTNCPLNHSSVGGKCFSWNEEVAHCFHCGGKWNKFSLVREIKNLTDKDVFEWFAEKAGMNEELKKSRKEYISSLPKISGGIKVFVDKREIAKEFIKHQPVYYERKGQFWVWDFEKFCWIEKDETDILNAISNNSNIDTISSKEKVEILEALKQVGRKNKPLDIKPTWVQFKNKIYDIETNEILDASPKYFVANPINWNIGKSEETPFIDDLIKSWVKEEDINKLYEIIAFVLIPKYFIHSFIFLYSPPGQGKSTFVNLIIKFIGQHNQTSTSLDRINNNTRFETYRWHKKLLITMSEVSHIDDLKNTGLINQATGEDPIAAEIKGGSSFNFINYGKFVYPTNKLVQVDSEDGFGRRVRVIKFDKTRFEKERDVLEEIPLYEFENLSKKCLRIAGELWLKRRFTGDVNISERMKNYQIETKTILERFIEEYCDITDSNAKMLFDEFYSKFIILSGQKESKINVSKQLRKRIGFEVKSENWQERGLDTNGDPINEWKSGTRIFGIKWKNEEINQLNVPKEPIWRL